jgi:hypothetical protein
LTYIVDFEGKKDHCLNEDDECKGPVNYHTTGDSIKAWPRCAFHQDRRIDQYYNSMEQYANSDVPPSWFDPADAGETW